MTPPKDFEEIDADDTLLEDTLLGMHQADSPEEVLRRLLDETRDAFQPRAMVVMLRLGEAFTPKAHFGLSPEAAAARLSLQSPVVQRLRTGAPLHVADFRAAVLRDLGVRRAIPALGRQELQAVIGVEAPDGEEDLWEFLRDVAPHLGTALENLSLRGRAAPPPAPSLVPAPAAPPTVVGLGELTRSFGLPGTLGHVGERVAVALARATQASRVLVWVLDASLDELVPVGGHNLADRGLARRIRLGTSDLPTIPAGRGVVGELVHDPRARLLPGPAHVGISWPDSDVWGRLLLLPLEVFGQLVGVVGLLRQTPLAAFDEAESRAAEVLDRAAIALHATQVYEPLFRDAETGLHDGRLVEALLGEAIRRVEEEDAPLTLISLRVAESAVHRGSGPAQAAPILEAADLLRRPSGDVDLAGHLGHGQFLAVLEDTPLAVGESLVRAWARDLAPFRGEVSIQAFAVVERRVGESAEQLASRAHQLCGRLVDEGPGVRVATSSGEGVRVTRDHVPSWVTPVDVGFRDER